MRNRIALVVSVLAFFAIYYGGQELFDFFDLQTTWSSEDGVLRHLGGMRHAYDEEESEGRTDLGLYLLVSSLLLAWRIYHWVLSGSWNGGISAERRATWLVWFLGLTAYAGFLIGYPLIGFPEVIENPVTATVAAGLCYGGYRLRWRLVRQKEGGVA